MKNTLYIILIALFIVGCQDETTVQSPADISSVSVEPAVGGAVLTWDMQGEEDFLYLNISYEKYPNNPDTSKIVETKASRHADSLAIEGLLHKYEYDFTVQPFNEKPSEKAAGNTMATESIRPIRRGRDTVYHEDDLTEIQTTIKQEMLDSFTHHEPAGPESNLFDEDIETIWHSDWYSGVEPLPHWIEINLPTEEKIGAIKYFLRQTSDERGFPTQFALATSEDGDQWKRRWTSEAGLPYDNVGEEKSLAFDKNYTSKHFRIMFLQSPGDVDWLHLAELDLYNMKREIVDREEIAEENY